MSNPSGCPSYVWTDERKALLREFAASDDRGSRADRIARLNQLPGRKIVTWCAVSSAMERFVVRASVQGAVDALPYIVVPRETVARWAVLHGIVGDLGAVNRARIALGERQFVERG